MKLLLDTHAFIWFITEDPRLSPRARSLICDGSNDALLNIASLWEVAIKMSLNKLQLDHSFEEIAIREIFENGFEVQPISIRHLRLLPELPFHHRDPFDRLIIAHALVDNLPVISADTAFDQYGVTRLW